MADDVTSSAEHMPAVDSSAFYAVASLHTVFYDQLYGSVADHYGDIAYYEALATQGDGVILDAACGTGRVFSALAKPGRRLFAFDVSDLLLTTARERAHEARARCPVNVTQQRLENFTYEQQFDLILLPYYCFSHLLDEASRSACLQNIARHLKPKGLAAIHLPAPHLLSREVPEQELQNMHAVHKLTIKETAGFLLEQRMLAMPYNPQSKVRSIKIQLTLTNPLGEQLTSTSDDLHYACITAKDLRLEATAAGLQPKELRTGFKPGVDTELVAVLGHR